LGERGGSVGIENGVLIVSVATESPPILTVTLPVELTNGNDGRGSRWFSSANVRKTIEAKLREWKLIRTPFDFPVTVHVTRHMGPKQRLWDSSSIGRGNWKEIEDALVVCGWFHDDGPKWIHETRFFQGSRSDKPSVVIQIFKSER
jgi:hypothetical protein